MAHPSTRARMPIMSHPWAHPRVHIMVHMLARPRSHHPIYKLPVELLRLCLARTSETCHGHILASTTLAQ